MKQRTTLLASVVSVVVLGAACASGLEPAISEQNPPPEGGRIVVAVLPFRHSSKDARYEPLAQSMGEMIAGCLSEVDEFAFVEREELDEVLKEHELTLSGLVDNEMKAKVGRLLGARYILTGGVAVEEKKLKVNAHLFEVETTRVAQSESAEGKIDRLLSVVRAVAEKLAKDLDLELPEIKEEDIDKWPEANLHLMRGLGYYYGNMPDHAIAEFMKALALKHDHVRARYWNGVCYFDDEEYEHAKIEFDRFLKEFPEDELAPKVKEMLEVCATQIQERNSAEKSE